MNKWFANAGDVYTSTIKLQLRVGLTSKLLSVMTARRNPTLRQMRPQEVVSRVVATGEVPGAAWHELCLLAPRLNRRCVVT